MESVRDVGGSGLSLNMLREAINSVNQFGYNLPKFEAGHLLNTVLEL
jgi:hypothetical protein